MAMIKRATLKAPAASAVVVIGLFATEAVGTAQSPPDEVQVTGKVRDFKESHVDFNVTPVGGNGHYAWNIGFSLAPDNRPAFDGTGFRVNSQWMQGDGYPIPPHLSFPTDALLLGDGINQDKNTVLDTWDSSAGPYDPITNSGPMPSLQIGWPMPTVSEPTGMGPSTGDAYYEFTVTLNSDIHCDNFTTRKETILNIDGDVTVFCEGSWDMGRDSIVNILPDSKLTIYVKGLFRVAQRGMVNMNTMDPSLLWIYNLGTTQMEINQSSHVVGTIISPYAWLHMAQDDHFYGKFIGLGIQQDQTTGVHMDNSPWPTPCGGQYNDVAGAFGLASPGSVDSSTSFYEWFHDTLLVNLSGQHTITLVRNPSGVYEYFDNAFFPIDDMMYGNEGASHNYNFTYEFGVNFVYRACMDQFFEFEGADDAWMFVDDALAMDLGGILPGTSQYVEMDRLNLVDGQQYTIRFFYAQRNGSTASFNVRTNVEFVKDGPPMVVSGGFD